MNEIISTTTDLLGACNCLSPFEVLASYLSIAFFIVFLFYILLFGKVVVDNRVVTKKGEETKEEGKKKIRKYLIISAIFFAGFILLRIVSSYLACC